MGINERGVIVGVADNRPASWASADAEPTLLSLPGPNWTGYATGIADDGTIVGRAHAVAGDTTERGFVWRGTERMELPPVLEPPAQSAGVFVSAIGGGWVIGTSDQIESAALTVPRTTRWSALTGEGELLDLARPGPINANGWLAGTRAWKLVLTDGYTELRLPPLAGQVPQPEHAAPIESVDTLSDDGRILAGTVTVGVETTTAVVWRCR
jgi:hypothetical protein